MRIQAACPQCGAALPAHLRVPRWLRAAWALGGFVLGAALARYHVLEQLRRMVLE